MAEKTIFQRLTNTVIGTGNCNIQTARNVTKYDIVPGNEVLYSFNSKEERDLKLKQMKQQRLLSHQWVKSGYDTSMNQLAGATQVRLMYRDCDLMDMWPEINSALDAYSEEATVLDKKNRMIIVESKSERIKATLEDLFNNRLNAHIMLPMIIRSTCKYGNEYMMLNISSKEGILGWREMPVHEMTRCENGISGSFGGTWGNISLKPDEVQFIWEGHNDSTPYKSWQIAHFRLIKNSIYLPYGCSILNGARRHWKMLSMMEDAMLLYRLERSVERRIFKVNVGAIDEDDVPAFLQEFMNNVKRAPIIDPQTGQIDLRKNFLDVSADYVIPVRNGQDPTSIDTLAAAQNPTSMEDIEYIQLKILSALRIPKTLINFQEPQGKGQNLSIMDIRFSRAVSSVQQCILLELTKVAIIHLYLLGFTDDLTNFSLHMNNPSYQIEAMETGNLMKRIEAATAALQETGCGIPIMSWHAVQKDIMGKSDKEISEMLNDIRLESALSIELQRTSEIIKDTGLFKQVDRIYGEPGAKYSPNPPGEDGPGGPDGPGGGPMGGGGGPSFGDELGDIGDIGTDSTGDIGGAEGSQDLGGGGEPLMEAVERLNSVFGQYMSHILKEEEEASERGEVSLEERGSLLSEDISRSLTTLEDIDISFDDIKE